MNLVGKKSFMPPLGLLTVAALCPQYWNLRLIDLNIEELTQSDLEWAELALISGMGIQQRSMLDTIDRCKRAGVSTLVGGPDATSSPDQYEDATYLILDEAEITLPMFLADFGCGKYQRVYTAEGMKPSITETPVPRFDLLSLDSYSHMCVQFSRGCPFSCEFCDITTLYGNIPRTKKPEQLLNELDAIYDIGFRGPVFLVDDNFIGNKKSVKKMLPELVGWMQDHRYPFSLYTEASLNLADDDELLEMMVAAGFESVFVGIESPSLESLRETRKYQNIGGDMLAKVHTIQRHGIEVLAGFILGFDHDDEEIFQGQIDFITAGKIPLAMVGMLHALPNTQLWTRLQEENRLLKDWTGDNYDLPNFKTKLPLITLIRGYRQVLATLYEPANFFSRLSGLIENMGPNKHLQLRRLGFGTKLKYLYPVIKALIWLGIKDKDGAQYWRFMWWVWRY
ncbi:MAG: B12-binding domain-containing radical SAM protein, partial [Candidatus Obscuribacterales bacterium]|nr:B12-binding domain-containing radical SAM protein [Candidatus Obscuribacterales bacterium]